MIRMTRMEQHSRVMYVKTNRMPALAGISKKVYELLLQRPLLSLEIKSADNINALLSSEKGHTVFLTPVLREDLFPKAEGCICELKEKTVSLQKVKKWDEIEIVAVRIQVKPVCLGRISAIEKKSLGEGVRVEVEKAVRCSIS